MAKFLKSNFFFFSMIIGIVAGCLVGYFWKGAAVLEPLGTLFINMMFCVVVPMVFFSISSAIANMKSAKRAGKLMGTTVLTFMCTTVIASVIMYVLVRFIPVYIGEPAFEPGASEPMTAGDMIVGFFTKPDFPELWSRRSILQLIIAGIFFGFGVQMCGGPETKVAKLLEEITKVLMKVIQLISYYAPIGFFGFFAALVAAHGKDFVTNYARAIILYYVVSFAYMFLIFPLYARFGGGKGAVRVMFQHLFRPAAVAFGTCSSVATIPTNMEVSEDTGISKDVTDIVLPMGATMNMDGSGMSAIIKVAFLFAMFGKDFATGNALIAIPAAAVPASWCSAPCSSPSSWPSPSPSPRPSATWWIPPPPWSTPPATMWPPTSSPASMTARIGCRRPCRRRTRHELYQDARRGQLLPHFRVPAA